MYRINALRCLIGFYLSWAALRTVCGVDEEESMKRRLVIFGIGDVAQLAHFYFNSDSTYEVAAFTVDASYLTEGEFCGLPVVTFEDLVNKFPPDKYDLFIALGYSKLNAVRKEKYLESKAKGYRLASFISPNATVLNEGRIGENCFVLEDNTIQPFVTIGDNVTLWSGNHIGHHSHISSHCFIASHVVISGGVEVGEQCFIGVNATIRDRIKIGKRSVVGAGALLLTDAEPEGVYQGNASDRSKLPSTKLRRI
jgi:sugar O-acyltransferase (sialic acid O-acetyltransferase NeuD family)